jgi:hypothetical protein
MRICETALAVRFCCCGGYRAMFASTKETELCAGEGDARRFKAESSRSRIDASSSGMMWKTFASRLAVSLTLHDLDE